MPVTPWDWTTSNPSTRHAAEERQDYTSQEREIRRMRDTIIDYDIVWYWNGHDWSWYVDPSKLHFQATAQQVQAAYTAIMNRGFPAEFNTAVWNDIMDKIRDTQDEWDVMPSHKISQVLRTKTDNCPYMSVIDPGYVLDPAYGDEYPFDHHNYGRTLKAYKFMIAADALTELLPYRRWTWQQDGWDRIEPGTHVMGRYIKDLTDAINYLANLERLPFGAVANFPLTMTHPVSVYDSIPVTQNWVFPFSQSQSAAVLDILPMSDISMVFPQADMYVNMRLDEELGFTTRWVFGHTYRSAAQLFDRFPTSASLAFSHSNSAFAEQYESLPSGIIVPITHSVAVNSAEYTSLPTVINLATADCVLEVSINFLDDVYIMVSIAQDTTLISNVQQATSSRIAVDITVEPLYNVLASLIDYEDVALVERINYVLNASGSLATSELFEIAIQCGFTFESEAQMAEMFNILPVKELNALDVKCLMPDVSTPAFIQAAYEAGFTTKSALAMLEFLEVHAKVHTAIEHRANIAMSEFAQVEGRYTYDIIVKDILATLELMHLYGIINIALTTAPKVAVTDSETTYAHLSVDNVNKSHIVTPTTESVHETQIIPFSHKSRSLRTPTAQYIKSTDILPVQVSAKNLRAADPEPVRSKPINRLDVKVVQPGLDLPEPVIADSYIGLVVKGHQPDLSDTVQARASIVGLFTVPKSKFDMQELSRISGAASLLSSSASTLDIEVAATWLYPIQTGDDLYVRQVFDPKSNLDIVFMDIESIERQTMTMTISFTATASITRQAVSIFEASASYTSTGSGTLVSLDTSEWEYPVLTGDVLSITQVVYAKKVGFKNLEVK